MKSVHILQFNNQNTEEKILYIRHLLTLNFHLHLHLHLHLQIDGEHSRSIERHFLFLLVKNWTFTKIQDEHLVCMIPNVGLLEHLEKWSPNGKKIIVPLPQPSYDLTLYLWNCIFGSNCPERIFQKIVTCLQLWQHFLHWFDCFNCFYRSITWAAVFSFFSASPELSSVDAASQAEENSLFWKRWNLVIRESGLDKAPHLTVSEQLIGPCRLILKRMPQPPESRCKIFDELSENWSQLTFFMDALPDTFVFGRFFQTK